MTPEQELRELKEKVEKLRNIITQATIVGGRFTNDYEKGFSDAIDAIEKDFAELLPPPRRGCWGFWMDTNTSASGRGFIYEFSRADAEREREQRLSNNPSPVIFLEEQP